jgi:hypothetical protein
MKYSAMIRFAKRVLFFSSLTFVFPLVTISTEYRFTVPRAKLVFGVSASLSDAVVMIVSTDQEESEELASGRPAILDLASSKLFAFPKLEILQIDSNATWTKDGHVLFETSDGIFEIDAANVNKPPKVMVAGKTHGIALSSDESKLTYWSVGDSSWNLMVRNTATSKPLRKWALPFVYGGEANGFEISFADESTIYARTFDSGGRTPPEAL